MIPADIARGGIGLVAASGRQAGHRGGVVIVPAWSCNAGSISNRPGNHLLASSRPRRWGRGPITGIVAWRCGTPARMRRGVQRRAARFFDGLSLAEGIPGRLFGLLLVPSPCDCWRPRQPPHARGAGWRKMVSQSTRPNIRDRARSDVSAAVIPLRRIVSPSQRSSRRDMASSHAASTTTHADPALANASDTRLHDDQRRVECILMCR